MAHEAFLSQPADGKDGPTVRESLQQVEDASGHRPMELDPPDFPDALEHVWGWFHELHGARTSGMQPNPISWSEIKAWAELTHTEPTPWEARLLRRLDEAFLTEVAKAKAKANG